MTAKWLPRWVAQGRIRSKTDELHHPFAHFMKSNSQAIFSQSINPDRTRRTGDTMTRRLFFFVSSIPCPFFLRVFASPYPPISLSLFSYGQLPDNIRQILTLNADACNVIEILAG